MDREDGNQRVLINRNFNVSEDVDLRQVVGLLWGNKGIIFGASFLAAVVGALISFFLLVPEFESRAVIMPVKDKGGSSGADLMSLGASVGQIFNLGATGSELTRYSEILKSKQMAETIVNELNLVGHYTQGKENNSTISPRDREKIVLGVREGLVITLEPELVRLAYRERDPKMAETIVKTFLDQLQHSIETSVVTRAKSTENFIAARLQEMEAQLLKSEDAYTALQQKKGILRVGNQLGYSLDTASQLRSQLIEKDMEINLYKNIMKDSAEIKRMEGERAQIQVQLDKLISGSGKPISKKMEIFTPLVEGPALEKQFANAEREYLAQVRLVELMRQQLELARIESKKSEPAFQVIDPPVLGIIPVFPKKKIITAICFLVGFVLSVLFILIASQFRAQLPFVLGRLMKLDLQIDKNFTVKRMKMDTHKAQGHLDM